MMMSTMGTAETSSELDFTIEDSQNQMENSSMGIALASDLCPFGVTTSTLKQEAWNVLGYLIMIVVTVMGNLLIILAIIWESKLRTLSNLFYVSLASADMLVGLVIMPPMIVYSLHGCWPLGALACDAWFCADSVLTSASFIGLSVIAADRYSAISDPFKHLRTQTKTRIRLKILLVWSIAFLAWVPSVFISRVLSGVYVDYECDDGAMEGVYALLTCIVLYHIPLLVMIMYYIRLYVAIRRQLGGRSAKKHSSSLQSVDMSSSETTASTMEEKNRQGKGKSEIDLETSGPDEQYGSSLESKRKKDDQRMRAEKEKRAAIMLGVIMVVFVVCWCGWVTTWPIDAMNPGSIPNWLYEFSVWSAYLNSTINPFLYVFSNQDFRVAIKKMLLSPFQKKLI